MEDQTAGAGGGVDPLVQRRERHRSEAGPVPAPFMG
jgi:hypothetical protein